jgi:MATE family multidrug resistance protein
MFDTRPAPSFESWAHAPLGELLRLSWPMVLSMLSYASMTLVDTLFVARLGAAALAGVGLAGVVGFILLCYPLGVARAVTTLVAQARGAGRRAGGVTPYVAAGLVVAMALGVGLSVLSWFGAPLLARVAAGPEAGAHATAYLSVRMLSAAPLLAYSVLREARHGLGDARTPMLAALFGNLLNAVLGYLFVVEWSLGVPGAAWATVIAETSQLLVLLPVQRRDGLGLAFGRRQLGRLFELGHPLGLQYALEMGAFALVTAVLAALGDVQMAAHQIAMQVLHFAFLPALAIADAGSVLVGQAVGARRTALVQPLARLTLRVTTVYTLGCMLVLSLFATRISGWFGADPELTAATARLLSVGAIFIVFDGANMVARGALRGAGDVSFAAYVGIGVAWALNPPITWWFGVVLGHGALGAWLGMSMDILVGAGVLWWRLLGDGWRAPAQRSLEPSHAA